MCTSINKTEIKTVHQIIYQAAILSRDYRLLGVTTLSIKISAENMKVLPFFQTKSKHSREQKARAVSVLKHIYEINFLFPSVAL